MVAAALALPCPEAPAAAPAAAAAAAAALAAASPAIAAQVSSPNPLELVCRDELDIHGAGSGTCRCTYYEAYVHAVKYAPQRISRD